MQAHRSLQPFIEDTIMNRKNLLSLAAAVIAIVGAGSAFAGEGRSISRHACTFEHGDRDYGAPCLPSTASALTRAQVRAETLEALRIGAVGGGDYALRDGLSAAQIESIRMAGQRALAMNVASR
jgi:hypothetical protein